MSVHTLKRERAREAINTCIKIKQKANFKMRVCPNALFSILNVSKDRGRNVLNSGLIPKEKHGGSKEKPL